MTPIMDEPTALASTIIPARRYGVRPDTGTDMTAAIQLAFDSAPAGCTLAFEPGVYIISDTVWLWSFANVSAYNVIFDLTTSNPTTTFTTSAYALPATYTVGGSAYLNRAGREAVTLGTEKFNTAAFVWGTKSDGSSRPNRTFVRGLRVRRTSSGTGPAGRKHCGIVVKSAFECRLEDTYSENFFSGLLLTNHTGQGTVYNSISKHTSWNDRYPFNLYAIDGGWVNQNTFYDVRILHGTGAGGVAESITDPGPIEDLRIMMDAGSTSRPNNNVFINGTFENGNDKCGRKLRLEGSDHIFTDCRWEGSRTNTESLTNGALTGAPPAEWTAGGDFALTGNAAVFTPSTNSGTLTQTSANFAVAVTANTYYHFEVSTSGTLPEGITMEVSGITDFAKRILVNASTTGHGVDFFSGATPGDLVFSVTVPDTHNSAITFDTLKLERIEFQFTIGAADGATTSSSNWARNIIEGGGTNLATILERGQIEYLQSGAWAWNQGTQINGGRALEWAVAGTAVNQNRAAYKFITSSTVNAILSIGHPATGNEGTDNVSDVLRLYTHRSSIPWAGSAMWCYNDNGGVTRNWFGMVATAPFDMRTWGGMNIGNVFRVRRDGFGSSHPYYVGGTAGLVENVNDDKIWMHARTVNGGFVFYNGNTGTAPSFALANTARDIYWDFRQAHSSLVTGQWGACAMFVGAGGSTPGNLANGMSLASTLLGGHADAYPIAFQRGVVINREGVDADTQVRGLNDDNLGYFDAGNDRFGIGTNAPGYKLHVVGTAAAQNLTVLNSSTVNGTIAPGSGTGSDVDDIHYDQARRAQGGRHWFTGGTAQASADTPVVGIMNVAGGAGALQVFYDSAGDRLMTIRIGNDSWTNSGANLEFYDATGATLYNALFQYDTVMGAGRPLTFRRGIWINHEQGDADTRMSSDTQTDCFYLDASALSGAGAIGIGTATPDSKLHVVGKIHGTDELELDGVLNHDGASVGFYGAAPAGQPTVTGSRGGNAALASLLTALAGLGLIVDSTTA